MFLINSLLHFVNIGLSYRRGYQSGFAGLVGFILLFFGILFWHEYILPFLQWSGFISLLYQLGLVHPTSTIFTLIAVGVAFMVTCLVIVIIMFLSMMAWALFMHIIQGENFIFRILRGVFYVVAAPVVLFFMAAGKIKQLFFTPDSKEDSYIPEYIPLIDEKRLDPEKMNYLETKSSTISLGKSMYNDVEPKEEGIEAEAIPIEGAIEKYRIVHDGYGTELYLAHPHMNREGKMMVFPIELAPDNLENTYLLKQFGTDIPMRKKVNVSSYNHYRPDAVLKRKILEFDQEIHEAFLHDEVIKFLYERKQVFDEVALTLPEDAYERTYPYVMPNGEEAYQHYKEEVDNYEQQEIQHG